MAFEIEINFPIRVENKAGQQIMVCEQWVKVEVDPCVDLEDYKFSSVSIYGWRSDQGAKGQYHEISLRSDLASDVMAYVMTDGHAQDEIERRLEQLRQERDRERHPLRYPLGAL